MTSDTQLTRSFITIHSLLSLFPQGKQNRGKFQCIAVPSRPTPVAPVLSPDAVSANLTNLPIDATTGKMSMPWVGKEWSTNKLGITPKCEEPTFEELAARFPGIHEADAAQRDLFAAAGNDEDMTDANADAPAKKPTVSLSRRTPSKSQAGTRHATPAPSTPGSPSLRSAEASSSSMVDDFVLATPSRMAAAGALWKSNAGGSLSTPSRSLVISGNKSKTLSKSWNAKRAAKDAASDAREKQQRIHEAQAEERREKARAIAQKAAYKKEQELKNQQVQVISDTRKIKAMSRKQLRSITKMDVAMANKGPSVTSKSLSRGTVPKGQ